MNTINLNLRKYFSKFIKDVQMKEIKLNEMFYVYNENNLGDYHHGCKKFYEELEYIKYSDENDIKKDDLKNMYKNYIIKDITKFTKDKKEILNFYNRYMNKDIIIQKNKPELSKLFWDEKNLYFENKLTSNII